MSEVDPALEAGLRQLAKVSTVLGAPMLVAIVNPDIETTGKGHALVGSAAMLFPKEARMLALTMAHQAVHCAAEEAAERARDCPCAYCQNAADVLRQCAAMLERADLVGAGHG